MTTLAGFLDSYYRLRPVNATFTGVHDYDDRLPDWSPDGLGAAIDEMRHLRASLQDDRAASLDLRETGPRDAALAVSFLDVQIAELDSLHFQRGNPSLAIGEAAFSIVALITRPFAPATERVRSLAGRLDASTAERQSLEQRLASTPVDGQMRSLIRVHLGKDRGMPERDRAAGTNLDAAE